MSENTEDTERRRSSRPPSPRKYRYAFGLSRHKQKLVMTFVAALVVITFLFGFNELFRSFTGDESELGKKIGTLGGKTLTDFQLQRAKDISRVHLLLAMAETENSPEFSRNVRKIAWRRLASLRYAAKLGITASKEDTRQFEFAQFSKDGVFNPDAYENFFSQRLPALGITAADFHTYMESALVLSRLENILSTAAWIPPYDMSREIAKYTDSFLIEHIDIPASDFESTITVTENDARTYFANTPRYFMQPDRMRVKYTVFPVSNFAAQAASLPESRAREYYESSRTEFQTPSNGVQPFAEVKDMIVSNLLAEAATNYYDNHRSDYTITDTNDEQMLKPFADVKEEIVRILARKDTRGLAEEKAMAFQDTMNPAKDGLMVPMERAASATNMVVFTSAYFGRYEHVPGLDVSLEFNRQAFESLRADDPYDHFSAPIVEDSAVYVISFNDKVESHVPDFNSVSNIAYELARKDKVSKATSSKAAEIRKALQTSLKAGKSFSAAAAAQKLTPVSTGPFSWLIQPTNISLSAPMIRALTLCKDKELTEPVPTTNGMAIAYVDSRADGRSTTDPSYMQFLAETIREEKIKRMFIDWQQHLVAQEKDIEEDTDLSETDGTTNAARNLPKP